MAVIYNLKHPLPADSKASAYLGQAHACSPHLPDYLASVRPGGQLVFVAGFLHWRIES
jgi:hypothetical protein